MRKFLFLIFLLFSNIIYSRAQSERQDSIIFEKFIRYANSSKLLNLTPSEVKISIAKFFLGTPYVAHTLESKSDEHLVVNLRQFDCTTFLENVVVLNQVINSMDNSFENYKRLLINFRYKDGVINGYSSRLHYFSALMLENVKNGKLKNITKQIGGEIYRKKLFFMTKNSKLYKKLKGNRVEIDKIKEIEEIINSNQQYYIPKNKLENFEDKIVDGDIIGITTKIKGLDCSHVGIAYKINNRLYFIHASLSKKEVVITEVPFVDYLKKIKKNTGVIIGRMIE